MVSSRNFPFRPVNPVALLQYYSALFIRVAPSDYTLLTHGKASGFFKLSWPRTPLSVKLTCSRAYELTTVAVNRCILHYTLPFRCHIVLWAEGPERRVQSAVPILFSCDAPWAQNSPPLPCAVLPRTKRAEKKPLLPSHCLLRGQLKPIEFKILTYTLLPSLVSVSAKTV